MSECITVGHGDEMRCNDCENEGILRRRGLMEDRVEIPILWNGAAATESGLQSPVLSFRTSVSIKSVIDFNRHWFSSWALWFLLLQNWSLIYSLLEKWWKWWMSPDQLDDLCFFKLNGHLLNPSRMVWGTYAVKIEEWSSNRHLLMLRKMLMIAMMPYGTDVPSKRWFYDPIGHHC